MSHRFGPAVLSRLRVRPGRITFKEKTMSDLNLEQDCPEDIDECSSDNYRIDKEGVVWCKISGAPCGWSE